MAFSVKQIELLDQIKKVCELIDKSVDLFIAQIKLRRQREENEFQYQRAIERLKTLLKNYEKKEPIL